MPLQVGQTRCPHQRVGLKTQLPPRPILVPVRRAKSQFGVLSRGSNIALQPFHISPSLTTVPQASFIESLTSSLRPKPPQPKKGGAKSVFVAGATGRSGARIVRELLELGYSVRAGCRNVESAQEAVDVAEACECVLWGVL